MAHDFLEWGDCEVEWVGGPGGIARLLGRSPPLRSLAFRGQQSRDWTVISGLTDLESLYANPWMHRTLAPLRPLKRLKRLFLNLYGRVTDLETLTALPMLEELRINGGTYIRDISALGRIPSLRHFCMHTWVGEIVLDSTEQLHALTQLETLELSATRFRHGSVRGVAALSQLKELTLDNRFPIQDCVWLASRMPMTDCWLFSPVHQNGFECDECGRRVVQLIGARRNRHVCPHCHPDVVTKHVKRFEQARTEAQKDLTPPSGTEPTKT